MVLIRNTNILVDDFQYSKRNEIFKKYIYFLTHLHTGKSNHRPLSGIDQLLQCRSHLLFPANQEGPQDEISRTGRQNTCFRVK